jgi:hypothetical protein
LEEDIPRLEISEMEVAAGLEEHQTYINFG